MMAFLRTVMKSVMLAGICAAWLQAQSAAYRVNEAPRGRPRIVSIAPPPPAPSADEYGPTVFRHLAATQLSDGSLAVDLGNAYQVVVDPCVYAYYYGCFGYAYPLFVYPTVFYTPVYVEPVYVAPVYAAPVYPTVAYPPAVYPTYGPRGCYSCVYRSRTYVRSAPVSTGALHAAAPRGTPGRVLPPARSSRP